MIDVILYKPSPYGLVFIHDKYLGLGPRVYHILHQTWAGLCVLYKAEQFMLYIEDNNETSSKIYEFLREKL